MRTTTALRRLMRARRSWVQWRLRRALQTWREFVFEAEIKFWVARDTLHAEQKSALYSAMWKWNLFSRALVQRYVRLERGAHLLESLILTRMERAVHRAWRRWRHHASLVKYMLKIHNAKRAIVIYRQHLASVQHAQQDSVMFARLQVLHKFQVASLRKVASNKYNRITRWGFQKWHRFYKYSCAFDASWNTALRNIEKYLKRKMRHLQRQAVSKWRVYGWIVRHQSHGARHCLRHWLAQHCDNRQRQKRAFVVLKKFTVSQSRTSFDLPVLRSGVRTMARSLLERSLEGAFNIFVKGTATNMADTSLSSPIPRRLLSSGTLAEEGRLLRGTSETLQRLGGRTSRSLAVDMAWRRVGKLRARGLLRHYLLRWRYGGLSIGLQPTQKRHQPRAGTQQVSFQRSASILLRFFTKMRSLRSILLFRGFNNWLSATLRLRRNSTEEKRRPQILHRCVSIRKTYLFRLICRRWYWWKAQTFPGIGNAALAHKMHQRASQAVRDRVRLRLAYAARTIFLLLNQGARNRLHGAFQRWAFLAQITHIQSSRARHRRYSSIVQSAFKVLANHWGRLKGKFFQRWVCHCRVTADAVKFRQTVACQAFYRVCSRITDAKVRRSFYRWTHVHRTPHRALTKTFFRLQTVATQVIGTFFHRWQRAVMANSFDHGRRQEHTRHALSRLVAVSNRTTQMCLKDAWWRWRIGAYIVEKEMSQKRLSVQRLKAIGKRYAQHCRRRAFAKWVSDTRLQKKRLTSFKSVLQRYRRRTLRAALALWKTVAAVGEERSVKRHNQHAQLRIYLGCTLVSNLVKSQRLRALNVKFHEWRRFSECVLNDNRAALQRCAVKWLLVHERNKSATKTALSVWRNHSQQVMQQHDVVRRRRVQCLRSTLQKLRRRNISAALTRWRVMSTRLQKTEVSQRERAQVSTEFKHNFLIRQLVSKSNGWYRQRIASLFHHWRSAVLAIRLHEHELMALLNVRMHSAAAQWHEKIQQSFQRWRTVCRLERQHEMQILSVVQSRLRSTARALLAQSWERWAAQSRLREFAHSNHTKAIAAFERRTSTIRSRCLVTRFWTTWKTSVESTIFHRHR